MSENDLREEILELVEPGSMTTSTIVTELSDDHSERQVKLEVVELITDGELEEHPEIDDVYRVPS